MVNGQALLIAGIVAVLLLFWLSCLADLMNRPDDEFPGRNDKLAWVLILIFLNIPGVFLYLLRKRVDTATVEPKAPLEVMRGSQPEIPETVPCPECRKPMPGKADKCPSCGWSYFKT